MAHYAISELPEEVEVIEIDAAHTHLVLFGDRSDPRTGLGFTVRLRLSPPPEGTGFAVTAFGTDFAAPRNYAENRPTSIQVTTTP